MVKKFIPEIAILRELGRGPVLGDATDKSESALGGVDPATDGNNRSMKNKRRIESYWPYITNATAKRLSSTIS